MTTMIQLNFDNSFYRDLPADREPANYRRQVPDACFSAVTPTPVAAPRLIAWSDEMGATLGLDRAAVGDDALAQMLSGNKLLEGMQPYAACYGGHQFGNWAGQLGDGRAISLGEVVNDSGERWELQLKGAGPTPYSRMGDGRAVMRSSVREFLCSEAMHHLGVPTTRALSLVGTGDQVVRDMFYDGNAAPEPGAIACRTAPSFLRFGNFQLLASRNRHDLLKQLADYAIQTHFPELGTPNPQTYAQWFADICQLTTTMVTHWMRVGFVHGVMNTDNMSILGLTIDYGPYGWLEDYDPHWTPNTTDANGRRYRFGHQPAIAGWNLVRFAESLLPLVGAVEPLQEALTGFSERFASEERSMMGRKLGLVDTKASDEALISDVVDLLQRVETDMTLFFRGLAEVDMTAKCGDDERLQPLQNAYYTPAEVNVEVREATLAWLQRYAARVAQDDRPDGERKAAMNKTNPLYVMRNYLAQLAIDQAEKGDGSEVQALLGVMRTPYDEQPGMEKYAKKRPEWARHRPGCSMLSCSS